MRSKYMYLTTKEILENNSASDFILNLLGENIYITPYTILHIISRHFAAVTRQYFSDKTHHNEDINPRNFHILLRDVFNIIDTSCITDKVSPSNIMLGYNDRVYMLYTSTERRFIKGKGEVSYRRLNTFFPIPLETVKKEIDCGCTVYQLRKNIYFYHRPATHGS